MNPAVSAPRKWKEHRAHNAPHTPVRREQPVHPERLRKPTRAALGTKRSSHDFARLRPGPSVPQSGPSPLDSALAPLASVPALHRHRFTPESRTPVARSIYCRQTSRRDASVRPWITPESSIHPRASRLEILSP